jgi:hypothetical protein
MRPGRALMLSLACAAGLVAGPARADGVYTTSDDTAEDVPRVTDERPPPSLEPRRPPSQALSMVSSIPRWPFIAGAVGVFVIMALLGLRRRRA